MSKKSTLLAHGMRCVSVALLPLFLLGCTSQASDKQASAASVVSAPVSGSVLRQDIAQGIYELVYSPGSNAVFVASSAEFSSQGGGAIYQLDPLTLAVQKTIALPLKPFALALDTRSNTLYAGHTLDGAVSAIDATTGTVKGTLHHGVNNAKGKAVHTRQIVVDEAAGQVIVSGVTDGGFIWVIDSNKFATERIIRDIDAPTAGLTLDAANHQLLVSGTAAYAVFDTRSWEQIRENRIPEKRDSSDARRRFLVNTALDSKSERLFANQLNNGEGTLVFDMKTGSILHTIPTGETPVGIRYNPIRNEVYVASRDSGTLSVIDATSYAIKHSIALPAHPNTVAVTPDGQRLYVSVKQPFAEEGQPAVLDQVVRIDLQAL
ncbi:YncE family protein [Alcaligenes nematophilus]|uniref:YncE family protein n=1 Tax=Alcaligenes nematophilus TaxID=2994643 RepID=UPI00384A4F3C